MKPRFTKDCEQAAVRVVRSGQLATGPEVIRFEKSFAAYSETRFGIACSSGTTALHAMLQEGEIGRGDLVLTSPFTFIASANAIRLCGAEAVFSDIDPLTFNLDPESCRSALKIFPQIKAILLVHLYGHPCDIGAFQSLAREFGVTLFEDCAQAHGARFRGKRIGSFGKAAAFSFYATKNLGTGEGGMVVTDDEALADRVKLFKDHGMDPTKKYWHPVIGFNYRMTNVHAAIGVGQLEEIESIIQRKLIIAKEYENNLKDIPGIGLPPNEKWAKNVYWLYSILVDEELFGMHRDDLIRALKNSQIETRPFFPPLHTQPIYKTSITLEVAEKLSLMGISLPSSSNLSLKEVQRVCSTIRKCHELRMN